MLTSGVVWLATGIALVVISVLSLWRRRSFAETFLRLVLVTYLGIVIAVTLFPLPLDPGYLELLAEYSGRQNNIIPFATMIGSLSGGMGDLATQVGGNMAMFFPVGLLVPSVWIPARKTRVASAVIAGSSLAIESAQFVVSTLIGVTYRSFDVDDLMLNTLGGLLGYLCFRFARAWIGFLRSRRLSGKILPQNE